MKSIRRYVLAVTVLLGLGARPVLADVGTPLVWGEMLHLLVGNLIIGVVEGLLVAVLYRTGKLRTTLLLIAANYISMLAGVGIFNAISPSPLGDIFGQRAPAEITLDNVGWYHLRSLLWILGLTVVLEFPFFWFIVRRQPHRYRRAILACGLAQFASYAMLAACYLPVSNMTVLIVERASPPSFGTNTAAWIYYINPQDGDVWRIHPDGSGRAHFAPLGITNRNARLSLRRQAPDNAWDLWATQWEGSLSASILVTEALTTKGPRSDWNYVYEKSMSLWDREPIWLTDPADCSWDVQAEVGWPDGGLYATHRNGQRVTVGLATPFLRWRTGSASVLPQDQVVFQLGDQVVLLDLNTRKLGLLALGRGPVVALDSSTANRPATSSSSAPSTE
jgi:hypothetical protein